MSTRGQDGIISVVFAGGSEAGAGVEHEEWNESSSGTEQEGVGTQLFWLDYQADSGHVTSFIVYKVGRPDSGLRAPPGIRTQDLPILPPE